MSHRYNETKYFNILLARGLTARLSPTSPVIVDTVNPGLCHSEIARNSGGVRKVIFSLMKAAVARTTEEGSRTLVWAATAGDSEAGRDLQGDPNLRESLRGAYSDNCGIMEPAEFMSSSEGQALEKRIWASPNLFSYVDEADDLSLVRDNTGARGRGSPHPECNKGMLHRKRLGRTVLSY
jgi:retinol dehydrogenase-12